MALTYPLAWPQPARIDTLSFDLSRVQAVSQTRGGLIQAELESMPAPAARRA